MQVQNLERKFVYNGITLPDPNPGLAPDKVREFYATQFPELNNSEIEGPETKGNVSTFKFIRAVGSKGADGASAEQLLNDALGLSKNQSVLAVTAQTQTLQKRSLILTWVARNWEGQSRTLPRSAFGFWG